MRFKYTAAVKLKLENTGKHLERIICIRPSTYQQNWKKIDFPTKSKQWKNFKIHSKIIAIIVLFSSRNRTEIKQKYTSKDNAERKNQVFHLMVTDSEKWHYPTAKNLPVLLQEINKKVMVSANVLILFTHLQQNYTHVIMIQHNCSH